MTEIINNWFNVTQCTTAKAETLPNTLLDLESNTAEENRAIATFTVSTGVVLNWTVDSYIIIAGYSGTGTGVRSQFLKVTN